MINLKLSNGIEMPAVGLGTFLMTPDQAEKAVYDALSCDYTLIDTAQAYMNERAVGRGIKKSGIERKNIFLSSKIWPSEYETEGTVEKSLELLNTHYIDLMFIHQPAGNFMSGYRTLEKAYIEGKIKSIGISNFHGEKLERLLVECEIKPHVIQMEAHPYFIDSNTMDMLKDCSTILMAWYPLGHGDKSLIGEPIFTELAAKYGKTNAQIILRWHTQVGNVVIPGSTNLDHIRENADIFDITLTDDEMTAIAKLNKNVRYYNSTPEMEESYTAYVIDLDSQP